MASVGDNVFVTNVTESSFLAQEAISKGLIVYDDGTGIALVDGPTNQATTETTDILGVALADAASGDVVSVASNDGAIVPVVAGGSGLAAGETVMAEYNTGRGIGVETDTLTVAAADWILGTCVKAAGAGDLALVRLDIHREEA
jgi:hypothetical protein